MLDALRTAGPSSSAGRILPWNHGAEMLRKLAVETVGTFFLVLTIGMVVIEPGAGALAPFAIGGVLMAMVYAGGHVSGAHYNPAVTLAVWIRGLTDGAEAFRYVLAQLVGAVVAAGAVLLLKSGGAAVALPLEAGPALLAELLFTFALVWVILNVATAAGTQGNSYFGAAIGLTVLVAAFAVGGVSGAALNPAVAVALVILGIADGSALWVYLLAQLLAAGLAAWMFTALGLALDKPTTATAADQARLEPAAAPARDR